MSEQLALVPAPSGGRRRPRKGPAADRPIAGTDPVALVLVDTPLAHLDRPFEYAVPAELDERAQPGVRVRVHLAGRDHDGFLVERRAEAEHTGTLAPLRSVVGAEAVLTPDVLAAARAVAARFGGPVADVLRLAVPPRHARAERTVAPAGEGDALATAQRAPVPTEGTDGPWVGYPAGAALLRRLASRQAPAAAWSALPGQVGDGDWTAAVAQLVAATLEGGRGSVLVVPDRRDVTRLHAAVEAHLGEGSCEQLIADLGPEARYSAFLRLLRGHTRVVVGTRSAAWAPVVDPGLFLVWDDGDDLHREPRTPYPHVRDVVRARAAQHAAGLVLGGFTRSVEAQGWVEAGVLAPVGPAAEVLRASAPSVLVAGEGLQEERDPGARSARIPTLAWRSLHVGLEAGPVLVQVPRQGYVASLACADCRAPVRCPSCSGPVGLSARGAAASCRWCGSPAPEACPSCGSHRRRGGGLGQERTAEELGRAFPGVRVVVSGGDRVVERVGEQPVLVVSTVGAEPWATHGYAAAALLDGWQLLERASLDAGVEALRRWSAAAAQVRPGGRVVLVGVPPHAGLPPVEALVRWDPAWLAQRELAERSELGLPPVRRQVAVVGPAAAVEAAVTELLGQGHEDVGRIPVGEGRVQGLVRQGLAPDGGPPAPALPASVLALRASRSARKADDGLRVQLDPVDLA